MLELDLFTMEWHGMIQFDTNSEKIFINTDRRDVAGTIILTRDINGAISISVRKCNEKTA